MVLMFEWLCGVAALVCFGIAGFGVPTGRVRPEWLAAAFLTLGLVVIAYGAQLHP